MTPEMEKQIEEQLAAVTGMYRNKQLEPDLYYKCLLCVAYEFSAQGEHLRALSISHGVPLEYFQGPHQQQMREDQNFATVSYLLAMALFQQGFIHLGPKVSSTMPPARA
jgi:hypothetical protein